LEDPVMQNLVKVELSPFELVLTKYSLLSARAHFDGYQVNFLFYIAGKMKRITKLDDHELELVSEALKKSTEQASMRAVQLRELFQKFRDYKETFQHDAYQKLAEKYSLPELYEDQNKKPAE
jgi:hypothetical protein